MRVEEVILAVRVFAIGARQVQDELRRLQTYADRLREEIRFDVKAIGMPEVMKYLKFLQSLKSGLRQPVRLSVETAEANTQLEHTLELANKLSDGISFNVDATGIPEVKNALEPLQKMRGYVEQPVELSVNTTEAVSQIKEARSAIDHLVIGYSKANDSVNNLGAALTILSATKKVPVLNVAAAALVGVTWIVEAGKSALAEGYQFKNAYRKQLEEIQRLIIDVPVNSDNIDAKIDLKNRLGDMVVRLGGFIGEYGMLIQRWEELVVKRDAIYERIPKGQRFAYEDMREAVYSELGRIKTRLDFISRSTGISMDYLFTNISANYQKLTRDVKEYMGISEESFAALAKGLMAGKVLRAAVAEDETAVKKRELDRQKINSDRFLNEEHRSHTQAQNNRRNLIQNTTNNIISDLHSKIWAFADAGRRAGQAWADGYNSVVSSIMQSVEFSAAAAFSAHSNSSHTTNHYSLQNMFNAPVISPHQAATETAHMLEMATRV